MSNSLSKFQKPHPLLGLCGTDIDCILAEGENHVSVSLRVFHFKILRFARHIMLLHMDAFSKRAAKRQELAVKN